MVWIVVFNGVLVLLIVVLNPTGTFLGMIR